MRFLALVPSPCRLRLVPRLDTYSVPTKKCVTTYDIVQRSGFLPPVPFSVSLPPSLPVASSSACSILFPIAPSRPAVTGPATYCQSPPPPHRAGRMCATVMWYRLGRYTNHRSSLSPASLS